MKKNLLYSPDVIGHPRVYCRVIADALSSTDCELVLAMGFTDDVGLKESPDLQPLMSRKGLHLLDNRLYSEVAEPHLCIEGLLKLQRSFSIDTTLFIEADKSNSEFYRIASGEAPRLHGRNLGIFAKAAEWYPGENSFTGDSRRILAPTLRKTLGNIKRVFLNVSNHSGIFMKK